MTDGMTGADIAALVNAAAMTAIKEHVDLKGGGKLEVSMRHFEVTLDKIKPKESSEKRMRGEIPRSPDREDG